MLKNLLPQTTTFLRGPHKLIIYKVMQLEGRGGVNFQIIPFTIDHSSTQMKKKNSEKGNSISHHLLDYRGIFIHGSGVKY